MLILLTTVFGVDRHIWAWGVGAIFATLACIMSFTGMWLTYLHCSDPKIKKNLIRVLAMVPIYATCAW